jgi:hypothetical protein
VTGATIVISPPDMPRITTIEQLLSTSVVSVLMQIEAGRLDDLDREMADAYLAAGSYLILDFADIRDAVEMQRRAHAAQGSIQ